MKEAVKTILWWLDESNAEARAALKEHNEELWQWLNLVEAKVNERLAQVQAMTKNDV
ncbi:MAG: hypothetical protein ACP5JY_03190 [Candidatus Nanoarchaeia archaeon]